MSDKPKTKRVRIAVAIDEEGRWGAGGYLFFGMSECGKITDGDEASKNDARGLLIVNCFTSKKREVFFIECDVPIPEIQQAQTLKGKVVK